MGTGIHVFWNYDDELSIEDTDGVVYSFDMLTRGSAYFDALRTAIVNDEL